MEQLQNGYTLEICEGAFPLSTDSMLLSGFVRLSKNAKVLDLGSGCGTLGTLLCARNQSCTVTGIEIDPVAHEAALGNIRTNRLEARLFSICEDFRSLNGHIRPGSYSCVISNPPYFHGGPAANLTQARREDLCKPQELFHTAARALRWGGDFFLVHRPQRLAELCACAAAEGLEPKRLCLVRHSPTKPVSLILLACRKGAKPGLIWEELYLHEENGEPSQAYRQLYDL